MILITAEAKKKLPLLGMTGDNSDPTAWVKIFDTCSQWTWFVTEFDPEEKMCFGLVIGHERKIGYFSLTELEGVRNSFGLPLERDKWFKPARLSEIA